MRWRGGLARRPAVLFVALGLVAVLACAPVASPSTSRPAENQAQPSQASAAASASRQSAASAAPERVRLSYAALSTSFSTAWVAIDGGIFARYGFDGEALHLPSRQASQALIAGDVDYGLFSGRTIAELRSQGTDVVVVAAQMLKILQMLIVHPSIQTPADLHGKRVGITQFGSSPDFVARYLLEQWGLRPMEEVTLLQLQSLPNIFAGLEGRAIDGGVLSPPISLQAVNMGYRELGTMANQPFSYPASVLAVRGSTLRERPDQVQRMVAALTEAIAYFKQNRDATEAILKAHTAIDDAAILRATYELYAPVFERVPLLPEEAMQHAIDEVAEDNPRARDVTPAASMDMRFVRELQASGAIDAMYR